MARYKVLKSVAYSFGHSFTSLMNYRGDDYVMGHLLRRAREVGEGTLRVDLLSGNAGPASLLAPPVADSVTSYIEWFPKLVASHQTSMQFIRSARMSIAFDLAIRRPVRYAPTFEESPYTCRVEIEDDRGKPWVAEIRDWWYPEAGTPGWDAKEGRQVSLLSRLGQLVRTIWSRSIQVRPNEELNPTGAPRWRLARAAREPHLIGCACGLTPAR